jgi:hypothetical protein
MGNFIETLNNFNGLKFFSYIDEFFRKTMINKITSSFNEHLYKEGSTLRRSMKKTIDVVIKEGEKTFGDLAGQAEDYIMESARNFDKVLVPYLEKEWQRNKWTIIGIFIALNPIAAIAFVISATFTLIFIYYLLLKYLIHPLMSTIFHKYIFKTK